MRVCMQDVRFPSFSKTAHVAAPGRVCVCVSVRGLRADTNNDYVMMCVADSRIETVAVS